MVQPSLTKDERRKSFKAEIGKAKTDGAVWWELANVLIQASEAADDVEEREDLRVAAEEATGLSGQILKRYVRLLSRTQKIAGQIAQDLPSVLSPVFNAQEVAVRLWDRAPNTGTPVLKQLAKGELTLEEVRQRLRDTPTEVSNPGEVARHAMSQTRGISSALIDRALEASVEQLWGKGSIIRRRPRLLYVGGHGYEVIGNDGSIVAGVDAMFPDPRLNRDYLASNVAPSMLLAPFFKQFYFAFAPTADQGVIGRAEALLDWFGYGWVGIFRISRDGSVTTVRKADVEPATRESMRYEALKRKFPAKRKTGRGAQDGDGDGPYVDAEDASEGPAEFG